MTSQRHPVGDNTHHIIVTEDGKLTLEHQESERTSNRAGRPVSAFAGDDQLELDIGSSADDGGHFTPGDRRGEGRVSDHGRLPLLPSASSQRPSSLTRAEPVSMHDLVRTYTPLLCCPACSPPARLVAPTTLHCGHTVCARHVRTEASGPHSSSISDTSSSALSLISSQLVLHSSSIRATTGSLGHVPSSVPVVPSCPLPTCRPRARQQVITPNIPPDSTVAYYPPIVQPSAPEFNDTSRITVPEPRPDVSIGRVLHLLESWGTYDYADQKSEDSDGADEESSERHRDDRDLNTRSESSLSSLGARVSRRRSTPGSNVRKRPRKDGQWNGSHYHHANRQELEERFYKELTESLTCEICLMLLYEPVSTPCQHTFCAKCLQRSLDHGTKCPLCRQELPPLSFFQDHPFNKAVLAILLNAFPEGYAERGRAIEEEERDGRLNTPIFVCQLSFPGLPTLLHFYEPRYRLMLRRCLESPRPCFGMIMPQRTVGAGSSDYGTMLEIRSVQMLPDGRSVVETMGAHRFRIMETGTLDGYMVGRIERVDDIPEELEDEAERSLSSLLHTSTDSSEDEQSSNSSTRRIPSPTIDELIAICHAFVEQLRNGTAPWVVQRLNNAYGPMPDDVGKFSYWMAQVLPIEEHEKAKLLVIRSPRARLRLVVYWIEQLNSNWWFSRGCCIS